MNNKYRLFNITLLLITLVMMLTSISYAWFVNTFTINNNLLGKIRSSYFERGTGTETDPFVIAKAEQLFNLSYLQNVGSFQDKVYHFYVSDYNYNPTTIDFSNANIRSVHKEIQPIGTAQYPFKGVFDGKCSTLKSYSVNGGSFEDVGTFGYLTGTVKNIFLETPTIKSNPLLNISTTGFHEHNDGNINIATGYIIGHIATNAIVQNVYVIAPKIDSITNAYLNRSQYGLIGFNEADKGNIAGGPRDQIYSFSLNAKSAYDSLAKAFTDFGTTKYINGTSTLLNQAIVMPGKGGSALDIAGYDGAGTYPTTYSLSTLKISSTANDPNPVFLYDNMQPITDQGVSYNRENIDIVGRIPFAVSNDLYTFKLKQTKSFAAPSLSCKELTPSCVVYFNPINYPQSIILYIKPTLNPLNLGKVSWTYVSGGGDLSYNSGWNADGTIYTPGSNRRIAFAQSMDMKVADALTAVCVDETTGKLMVVNTNEHTPDYYIFLISLTNGQTDISDIHFDYIPAKLSKDSFMMISNVDFINNQSEVLNIPEGSTYDFSLVNFGYELIGTQGLEIITSKLLDQSFEINFNYTITDGTFFYLDIFNINKKQIIVKRNNVIIYPLTGQPDDHQVISIKIETNNITITTQYVT